ncbi:RrF2 family transcriptional regulator [Haliangium ochraceum]|nr:Rrf2 family transcriptional regulator [Haliangium ochraceum]
MLRISKMTDYAVALTSHLAQHAEPRAKARAAAGEGSARDPAESQIASKNASDRDASTATRAGDVAHRAGEGGTHQSVRALAAATGIPEPTVRKVLKTLVRAGVVGSVRGTHGGYALARPASAISVAEVATAFEGPIAVTECASEETVGTCGLEDRCTVKGPWQRISEVIRDALEGLSLAQMSSPAIAEAQTMPVEALLRRTRKAADSPSLGVLSPAVGASSSRAGSAPPASGKPALTTDENAAPQGSDDPFGPIP